MCQDDEPTATAAAATSQPEAQELRDWADSSSDYGSDYAESDTTSLSSAIFNYKYENGRRYHSYREGNYVLPNDEAEQDRLDLMHHVHLVLLKGELMIAPLENPPQRILDVGTGTGIWAIDIADKYPSAEVIANDLSPIQPTWVPPNLKFEVDDIEADWHYAPNSFDLVHGRCLAGCIADWPKLYSQMFKALKPGGTLEIQEVAVWVFSDIVDISKSKMIEMDNMIDRASLKSGRRMNIAHLHKQWMIDAGFEDVHEEIYKLPNGPWRYLDRPMRELGRIQRAQQLEALEPFCLALGTRYLGMTTEDVMKLVNDTRKEILSGTVPNYSNSHFVYGRKPFNA